MPRLFFHIGDTDNKNMNLEQEILKVLTLADGKGLKTEKIARHVFNACNSMFNPLNYKEVHTFVSQYLIKAAKDEQSPIEKDRHGIYQINVKTQEAQQLMLRFGPHDSCEEVEEDSEQEDQSLSLF